MAVIRMLMTFSGGRYDGRDWPPYNGLIDVPQWEAEQLIGGGNAEPATEEELDRGYEVLRVPDPNFEDRLREGYEDEEEEDEDLYREDDGEEEADFDEDFDRDEEASEAPEVKQPYSSANKDTWIDYAVYKGGDRKQVAELTKAQIISKYAS